MKNEPFYSAEIRFNTTNSLVPGLVVTDLPGHVFDGLLLDMLAATKVGGLSVHQTPTWKLFAYWVRRHENSTGYKAGVTALRAHGVEPTTYMVWTRIQRAAYLAIHDVRPARTKRAKKAKT